MAGIYSSKLCDHATSSTLAWEALFTVPSGQTCVIKEIDSIKTNTGAAVAYVRFGTPGNAFARFNAGSDEEGFTTGTFQVGQPGDVCEILVTANVWTIRISGYLLGP